MAGQGGSKETEDDPRSNEGSLLEQILRVEKLKLDPPTEIADEELDRSEEGGKGKGQGSWSTEGGLQQEEELAEADSSGSPMSRMKEQRDDRRDSGGGKRHQASWDTGTRESNHQQQRSGWDEEIVQTSSWTRTTREPPMKSEYPSFDLGAGNVDPGYYDQAMPILGTDVVVRVAYTAKSVEDWIDNCPANERIFGFDIEWRPNFQKGRENYAALCQLSTANRCLIVQLLYMDFIPNKLKALLVDPRKKLAGVGVKGDVNKLYEDYGLKCRGEVDLGVYAADIYNDPKLKQAGLAALCCSILGIPFKKNRKVTMSKWDVQGLSYTQISYAATDAWIAHSLLTKLEAKKRELSSAGQSRAGVQPSAESRPSNEVRLK